MIGDFRRLYIDTVEQVSLDVTSDEHHSSVFLAAVL